MTNVWTARASFAGTARVYAAGFSIGSKGYIGTGQDGSPYVSDYWQYSAINDAVNEINLDNYFSVSPNPTSGVFELRIADCQNCGLKIYNTLGEIVHQSEIHTPQSKIDLSASPGGVYFLQLTTDKGIARKKIVISK
ncbi:MAG: T9SS type A sorting domain-containing protein [Bacteroidetes bacterium]|nr:T9SS type A sorting domain-containing protein [Bacteroidota bacterium]